MTNLCNYKLVNWHSVTNWPTSLSYITNVLLECHLPIIAQEEKKTFGSCHERDQLRKSVLSKNIFWTFRTKYLEKITFCNYVDSLLEELWSRTVQS